MKLSKSQRHTAYILMWCEIKDIEFFCHCMSLFDFPINETSIGLYFPELYNYKPLRNLGRSSQWFIDSE
jgi:hypothetical protein